MNASSGKCYIFALLLLLISNIAFANHIQTDEETKVSRLLKGLLDFKLSSTFFSDFSSKVLREEDVFGRVLDEAKNQESTVIGGANLALSLYDFNVQWNLQASDDSELRKSRVREMYWEHSWDSGFNLTLGRRIIRTGTGYVKRPTSLLEGGLYINDPEDIRQRMIGTDMALIEWFGENGVVSLAWVDSDRNVNERERPRWFARYATLVGETDLAVVGGVYDYTLGVALSRVFGEGLEIHADVLCQQGTSRQYHKIIFGGEPELYRTDPNIRAWEEKNRIFLYALLGGQITAGEVNIIFEWLHDSRGLTGSQFRRWNNLVKYHKNISENDPTLSKFAEFNLLWDLNTLKGGGIMQNYIFLRVAHNTGNLRPETNMFINAYDGSFIVVPGLRFLHDNWDLQLRASFSVGGNETEFGRIPQSMMFGLHVRFYLPIHGY